MHRTPVAGLRAYLSRDPLDIEDDSRGGLQGFGPELILVLTALTAVALVAGAVSAPSAVMLLAACTGIVVLTGMDQEPTSTQTTGPRI